MSDSQTKCEFKNLKIDASICGGAVRFNSIDIKSKNGSLFNFPLMQVGATVENKCLVVSYQILSLLMEKPNFGVVSNDVKVTEAAAAAAAAAVTEAAAAAAAAAEAAAEAAKESTGEAASYDKLLQALETLLSKVNTISSATEAATIPPSQGGGSTQTLMNHIIDNKPNMTSMYPVKVTRRRYYRNSRGRRNGRNNRTNRRRRRSYTRR